MTDRHSIINQFLARRDLTREELMKLADVSAEALHLFENGDALSSSVLKRIAKVLRVSAQDLNIEKPTQNINNAEEYSDNEKIRELTYKEIGQRLIALRKTKGIKTQAQAAKLLEVSTNCYNNWERGEAIIGVNYAIKMAEITGADLDYIYRGHQSGLTMQLIQALETCKLNKQ